MIIFVLTMLAGTAPAAAPAQPVAKPMKICREGRPETGTHMRVGRTCKTADQWAKEDAEKQKYLPVGSRIMPNQEDAARESVRPH